MRLSVYMCWHVCFVTTWIGVRRHLPWLCGQLGPLCVYPTSILHLYVIIFTACCLVCVCVCAYLQVDEYRHITLLLLLLKQYYCLRWIGKFYHFTAIFPRRSNLGKFTRNISPTMVDLVNFAWQYYVKVGAHKDWSTYYSI